MSAGQTDLLRCLLSCSIWSLSSLIASWWRLRRLASDDSCWTLSSSRSLRSFTSSCSRRRVASPYIDTGHIHAPRANDSTHYTHLQLLTQLHRSGRHRSSANLCVRQPADSQDTCHCSIELHLQKYPYCLCNSQRVKARPRPKWGDDDTPLSPPLRSTIDYKSGQKNGLTVWPWTPDFSLFSRGNTTVKKSFFLNVLYSSRYVRYR